MGDVEIRENGFLYSLCGMGFTPNEAVASLARQVSGKTIVVGAYLPHRREHKIPILEDHA